MALKKNNHFDLCFINGQLKKRHDMYFYQSLTVCGKNFTRFTRQIKNIVPNGNRYILYKQT